MDIALTEPDLHVFFNKYFSYYNTLDAYWQKIFVRRVQKFIRNKAIYGAQGFQVNNKVMAIVAASAVQLSLGLDTWDYDYFNDIIIHPSAFSGAASKQLQKGETNLKGFVRLSWSGFVEGYKNMEDNVNLGIHEFAHALRFNSIRGNEEDYYLRYFFIIWMASAYEAHHHLKQGRESIFRAYGGTNINEFMSVCMEHYFESPLEIKEAYPLLYFNTAILLNQFTVNNKTQLNIRDYMLQEKNRLALPMNEKQMDSPIINSNWFPLIIGTFTVFLITVLGSGLFSGPTLILLLLCVLVYLRLDYHKVKVHVKAKHLEFEKGYMIFRKRKTKIVLISQLIRLSIQEHQHYADVGFMFYNALDKHFYDESAQCSLTDARELFSEFRANKVPVKRI